MPAEVFRTLYDSSGAAGLDMSLGEFSDLLLHVEASYPDRAASGLRFYETLEVGDLVLAHSCASGNETAWERFLARYSLMLHSAAMILCGSKSAARELVSLLMGDLFGTRVDANGKRCSKLVLYTGRGSLSAWLRATLAQTCIDQHRLRRRFVSLDEALPFLAGRGDAADGAIHIDPRLGPAIELGIRDLAPESRLLLKAHYLDQMTLAEIARLMDTHESTISRRIARATRQLRRSILQRLVGQGMSISAARQALASDVRYVSADIEGALVRVV